MDIVDAKIGLRLRYFTAHAFGVLVEGNITHVNQKLRTVTIDGPHGPEICGLERGFYHPRGHPNQGDEFKLTIPAVKTKV